MGFVCAFRGRRDSYQLPAAMAEVGLLDTFITDHYYGRAERLFASALPGPLAEKLHSRFERALPTSRVLVLRTTAIREAAARFANVPAARVYDRFDPRYGEAAAREARRNQSDLLMYSSYAWEAFNARYIHTPRKVLFQYHPHHQLENAILAEDRRKSAVADIEFRGTLENSDAGPDTLRHRADAAWQLADRIVCASSFTKQSLVEAGADPARIAIVPYGVEADIWTEVERHTPKPGFRALFVGSGLQRKGLHHLLRAWGLARLPACARLTVVARVIDPGLVPLLERTKNISLRRGVTGLELRQLYSSATVFVMPSLIEGFGQVYLEALAHGLPVVGTANTCLPDVGGEADGVFLTGPGDLDELIAVLERLSDHLDNNQAIRGAAISCAKRFTWEQFRRGLRDEVL